MAFLSQLFVISVRKSLKNGDQSSAIEGPINSLPWGNSIQYLFSCDLGKSTLKLVAGRNPTSPADELSRLLRVRRLSRGPHSYRTTSFIPFDPGGDVELVAERLTAEGGFSGQKIIAVLAAFISNHHGKASNEKRPKTSVWMERRIVNSFECFWVFSVGDMCGFLFLLTQRRLKSQATTNFYDEKFIMTGMWDALIALGAPLSASCFLSSYLLWMIWNSTSPICRQVSKPWFKPSKKKNSRYAANPCEQVPSLKPRFVATTSCWLIIAPIINSQVTSHFWCSHFAHPEKKNKGKILQLLERRDSEYD